MEKSEEAKLVMDLEVAEKKLKAIIINSSEYSSVGMILGDVAEAFAAVQRIKVNFLDNKRKSPEKPEKKASKENAKGV